MEQTNQIGSIGFLASKPHRGHVDKIYAWCKSKYGRSRYNGRYPDIAFKKSDYYTGEDWGYYDEDEQLIYINKDKHENLEDLVHTIVHEYTHYKQSMYHYRILSIYLDPHENPLELEADMVAERDTPECLVYLESLYETKKIVNKHASKDLLTVDQNIY
jgi:hypothetical protein